MIVAWHGKSAIASTALDLAPASGRAREAPKSGASKSTFFNRHAGFAHEPLELSSRDP
jgi:hypothetical protein